MRKTTFILMGAIIIFIACNNNQKSKDETVQVANDSLSIQVTESLEQQEVDNMIEIINAVSATMDSIQMQEKIIFNMKEGTPKEQVVAKLQAFRDLLAKKQKQIDNLTVKNSSNKSSLSNLQKMVDYLRNDMDNKNKQISQLQELVQKKDISISSLRYSLDAAQQESNYLKDQNFEQDQQLNTIYYFIGDKSELKEKGMIKGGFLSKKRADYTNLDRSQFIKRDKRGFTKLVINSKKPVFITEKPKNSYTLTRNDDGTTTLEITDINAFWNTTQFLIIQK